MDGLRTVYSEDYESSEQSVAHQHDLKELREFERYDTNQLEILTTTVKGFTFSLKKMIFDYVFKGSVIFRLLIRTNERMRHVEETLRKLDTQRNFDKARMLEEKELNK